MVIHDLSLVDAALVGLAFMDRLYPKAPERMREFKRLAKALHIPVAEDPALAAQRHREMMAQVEADFG